MSIDINTRRVDLASAFIGERPVITTVLPGLARGTTGLIVGPTGSSKSYLALQTAISIALGEDLWALWADGAALPPGKVLVVELEDPEDILLSRLHDIGASVGLTDAQQATIAERVTILSLYGAGFRWVTRRNGELAASEWVGQLTQAASNNDLVIVDTLNLSIGGLDENSSGDMGAVVAIVSALCRDVGCACLLVHHMGKTSTAPGRAAPAARDAARGSSAIGSNTRWQTLLLPMTERDAKERGLADDEGRRWIEVDLSANYGPGQPRRWLYRGEGGVLDGRREPPPAKKRAEKKDKAPVVPAPATGEVKPFVPASNRRKVAKD